MKITKSQILDKFNDSTIKIKSLKMLEKYIYFCFDKNQKTKIKSKTSYHHILPNKSFPEFSNLKDFPWNGTHLMYSDHYYAHWLLTEAIDDFSQLFAFCAMHNKDLKLGRIQESDLILPKMFQEKMEERSIKHIEWYNNSDNTQKINNQIRKRKKTVNSKEWKETKGKEQIKKYKETVNSKEWKETKGKEAIKKYKETVNSKEWKETKGKEKRRKQVFKYNSREWKETTGLQQKLNVKKTKNSKEWKETIGKATIEKLKITKQSKEWKETKGKEAIRKQKETVSSKEWKETKGKAAIEKLKITKHSKEWKETKGKEAIKKYKETVNSKEWKETKGKAKIINIVNTREKKGRHFDVYNHKNIIIYYNISINKLNEISQILSRTSIEKCMGHCIQSKVALNKSNNLHIIGWYVKEI